MKYDDRCAQSVSLAKTHRSPKPSGLGGGARRGRSKAEALAMSTKKIDVTLRF
jgi:hypothetical protein